MSAMLSAVGQCLSENWSPTIGDPSVMGWITVAAYGLASGLCVLAFGRQSSRRLKVFGFGLAVLLALLMVNKQLDLQSALTAAARCLSQLQGWYEDRRAIQIGFILVLLLYCLGFGLFVVWIMRRHLGQIWLMLLGLILLLAFIAVRAVGFHHFDAFISSQISNVRMNWVLELGGLAMIAVNAIWILFTGRGQRISGRGR
ncbi:isopropylmalate isomerase [Sedimentitalea todarodis]|uniref:Isopropylmalate isomerase n=1 Tax=Sedimentitalea todarodis TaxID=1631240 RepID=A0ABU3VCM3_9RHOB|nr:isopropylmalate isomerase [Sedimentitalea todarodis]MDU9003915.1 isopropylmalate isomerase [Sedimentitalea todarodis]